MRKPEICLSDDRATLRVGAFDMPALWLLDQGEGAATRDPKNGQRLIDLATAPADLRIDQVTEDETGVDLTFTEGSSWFSWETLASFGDVSPSVPKLFHAGDLDNLPCVSHADFMAGGEDLLRWLQGVEAYGFGRIQAGPTHSGSLFEVIDQFGYVRETNYGRHFEVRTEPNPTNLAFTGLGLPPHTDNPYRDPVPTLQLLYCLENSATGGESQVVDGFAVAEALREENPGAFDVLTRTTVPFAFVGQSGVHLVARRPLIEVDEAGALKAVCYNTRSMQALMPRTGLDLTAFMAAYHRLGQLMNDPAFLVEFALQPGECFLVNNLRVLHARSAYQADGHRWLQGAYADLDSLLSKCRVLEAQR